MKRGMTIAGLVLALGASGPGVAAAATFTLGAGADYRWTELSWYFYGSPFSRSAGSEAALPAVALEGLLRFPLSERAFLGAGVGASVGSGNASFWVGSQTRDEPAKLYHAAVFGEGGFALASWLGVLGRVGVGVTDLDMSPAEEGSVDLVLAAGLAFQLSERVGVGVLYEASVANLDAWTDSGVTSAEPSLENWSGDAVQARLFFRF